MATRWVVDDDTSADIHYVGGSWFGDTGSQDSVGNFGPPFLSTLHGTNTSASLALNFTGSAVRVVGTNSIRNDSGVIDPQWSCSVDGVGINSGSPFQYPENNWLFCSSSSLTDGPHTITVNATVAKSQTFWFDFIEYAPSASVPLANKTIRLTSPDSTMQFGTGWNDYGNIGNWTQTPGALFALNFYGTSLSWYGHIPTEWSGNSTTATWVVDDNPAQVFLLKGHEVNASTAYNQKFFETSVYPDGLHKLTVTYNGDSSKTPLVLAYLVIQNNTVANSTVGSSPGTHTTSSQTPAIIGGVIGGVACLLLVILLVLYRRRLRPSDKEIRIMVDEPADYVPDPSIRLYDPPSRLPAKSLEGYPRPSNILSPGPSGISVITPDTSTSHQHHSRTASNNNVSESVANPSNFVVHQDSAPLVDIPPAYTPD